MAFAVPLRAPVDLFDAGLNGVGGWVSIRGDVPSQVWDLPTQGFADPDARFEYVEYAGLPSIRFVYDTGSVREHVLIAHSREGVLWVSVKARSGSDLAPSVFDSIEPTLLLRPIRATNRLPVHFPETECIPRLSGEPAHPIGGPRRQYSYVPPAGKSVTVGPMVHGYTLVEGEDELAILIETDPSGLGRDALSAPPEWVDETVDTFAGLLPFTDVSYRRIEALDCPAYEFSGLMDELPATGTLVLDGSATLQILCIGGISDSTACVDTLASFRRLP